MTAFCYAEPSRAGVVEGVSLGVRHGNAEKHCIFAAEITTGVLAQPPLTKQEYDSRKRECQCAVYAFVHTVLRLPDCGKLVGDKANRSFFH